MHNYQKKNQKYWSTNKSNASFVISNITTKFEVDKKKYLYIQCVCVLPIESIIDDYESNQITLNLIELNRNNDKIISSMGVINDEYIRYIWSK